MKKSFAAYFRHERLRLRSWSKKLVSLVSKPAALFLHSLSKLIVRTFEATKTRAGESTAGIPTKILLVPYAYPPTVFLHSIVQMRLEREGVATRLVPASSIEETLREGQAKPGYESQYFDSMRDAVNVLVELADGDEILATSIVDQYVRYEPVRTLTKNFEISSDFLSLVHFTREVADNHAENNEVLVTGDSSYLLNGALIAAFLRRGKRVYVLDFVGKFREVTLEKSERRNRDFFYSKLEVIRAVQHEIGGEREAQVFLESRFSGEAPDDEVAAAFRRSGPVRKATENRPRKVLFLHVLRDANGQVGSDELGYPLFRTYIEWTDAALRIVSENPDDWIVKPHPGFEKYPGEREILFYLFHKHGLSLEILDQTVNAREVLENRLPVYSHDGTIVREAACFGYKAYSVSVHLPEEITVRAKTLEEFEIQMRLPPTAKVPEIHDSSIVRAARLMLHDHVSEELVFLRRNPKLTGGGSYLSKKLHPSRVEFRLARMVWTRGGQGDLEQIIRRLLGWES